MLSNVVLTCVVFVVMCALSMVFLPNNASVHQAPNIIINYNKIKIIKK